MSNRHKNDMDDFFAVCPPFDPRARILRAEAVAFLKRVIATWFKRRYGGAGLLLHSWELIPYGSYAMGLDTDTSDIDCCFTTDCAKLTSDVFFTSLQSALRDRSIAAAAAAEAAVVAEGSSGGSVMHVVSSKVIAAKSPLLNVVVAMPYDACCVMQHVEFDVAFHNLAVVPSSAGNLSETTTKQQNPPLYSRSWHGVLCARELLRFATNDLSSTSGSFLFSFVHCVRFLKRWATARGVYNSKLGYFGGIHLTVMFLVAAASAQFDVCDAPLTQLLAHFFRFYSRHGEWRWPEPVRIRPYYWKGPFEDVVFNPVANPSHRRHVMPVLTPVYPFTDIFFAATAGSMAAMQNELDRASSILNITSASRTSHIPASLLCSLLEPCSPPPKKRKKKDDNSSSSGGVGGGYLRVFIYYTCLDENADTAKDLAGFVESRVYKLAQRLEESPCVTLARSVVITKGSAWCIHVSVNNAASISDAADSSSPSFLQRTISASADWWKKRVLDKAGIEDSSIHHIRLTLSGNATTSHAQ